MRSRENIFRAMLAGGLYLGMFCAAAGALELTVIMPGGGTISVSAAPEQTIKQLKETIYSITSLSPLNQTLTYQGKRLAESGQLSALKLSDGDTLRVVHDVHAGQVIKQRSSLLWVLPIIAVIVGIGVFFMRRKPSWEYDGK